MFFCLGSKCLLKTKNIRTEETAFLAHGRLSPCSVSNIESLNIKIRKTNLITVKVLFEILALDHYLKTFPVITTANSKNVHSEAAINSIHSLQMFLEALYCFSSRIEHRLRKWSLLVRFLLWKHIAIDHLFFYTVSSNPRQCWVCNTQVIPISILFQFVRW